MMLHVCFGAALVLVAAQANLTPETTTPMPTNEHGQNMHMHGNEQYPHDHGMYPGDMPMNGNGQWDYPQNQEMYPGDMPMNGNGQWDYPQNQEMYPGDMPMNGNEQGMYPGDMNYPNDAPMPEENKVGQNLPDDAQVSLWQENLNNLTLYEGGFSSEKQDTVMFKVAPDNLWRLKHQPASIFYDFSNGEPVVAVRTAPMFQWGESICFLVPASQPITFQDASDVLVYRNNTNDTEVERPVSAVNITNRQGLFEEEILALNASHPAVCNFCRSRRIFNASIDAPTDHVGFDRINKKLSVLTLNEILNITFTIYVPHPRPMPMFMEQFDPDLPVEADGSPIPIQQPEVANTVDQKQPVDVDPKDAHKTNVFTPEFLW